MSEHLHVDLSISPAGQQVQVASAYLQASAQLGLRGPEWWGTDLTAMPDLAMMTHSGLSNLAEALVRRLITPRGKLFYDPEYGIDLRSYLNEAARPEVLYEIQRRVEEQCELDPRVQSAQAQVQYEAASRTLRVHVDVELADERSPQLVPADQVTLEVLRAPA